MLVFLAGCATQPSPTSSVVEVDGSEILEAFSFYREAGPETALVVVKRDPGLFGSGCAARLHVNARPVADSWPGRKGTLNIPAGDQVLSVRGAGGICSYSNTPELGISIRAGSSNTYRIGVAQGGNFELASTAFQSAFGAGLAPPG